MSIEVQMRNTEKRRMNMELSNMCNTLSLRRRSQNWRGASKMAARIKKISEPGRFFLPAVHTNQ